VPPSRNLPDKQCTELRRDLGVDDKAMPVALGFLGQLYGLRR
jgi:hypothetical protein